MRSIVTTFEFFFDVKGTVMNKYTESVLLHIPFLHLRRVELIGEVVQGGSLGKRGTGITLKEAETSQCVGIQFPRYSCTPDVGDVVKVCCLEVSIFFLSRPRNLVVSWYRSSSPDSHVHNTIHKDKQGGLHLSALL